MNRELQQANKGATPVKQYHKQLLSVFFAINSIGVKDLRKVLREQPGIQLRFVFKILLLVETYPFEHIKALERISHSNWTTIKHAIDYLMSAGYIQVKPRSRLILPLDRWTYDQTYRTTKAGERFIREILQTSGII